MYETSSEEENSAKQLASKHVPAYCIPLVVIVTVGDGTELKKKCLQYNLHISTYSHNDHFEVNR